MTIYSKYLRLFIAFTGIMMLSGCSSCKYGFKDVSPIPSDVKTFRVTQFENRAQYVNSQFATQLTERTKQKIIGTVRLRQTNNDDAHYDISGYVSQYYASTVSITGRTSSGNRLNISFHLIFKNTLDNTKDFETDITRTYDFEANKSLTEAESTILPKAISDTVDDIFNKIFSNW